MCECISIEMMSATCELCPSEEYVRSSLDPLPAVIINTNNSSICKVSVETILSAYTHTQTRRAQAPAYIIILIIQKLNLRSRDLRLMTIAQWLERRTRDLKVAGSNPHWSSGRIFFSRVNFLC